jgi:hypothetical protein
MAGPGLLHCQHNNQQFDSETLQKHRTSIFVLRCRVNRSAAVSGPTCGILVTDQRQAMTESETAIRTQKGTFGLWNCCSPHPGLGLCAHLRTDSEIAAVQM